MTRSPSRTTFLKSAITAIAAATGILLSGCSESTVQPETTPVLTGAAEVEIQVGKIGVLAKKSTIEMNKLIVEIVKASSSAIVVTDTSSLSGYSATQIKKTFEGLNAPDIFILQVRAIDKAGKVIHSGSKTFSTVPAGVVDVKLDLSAQYSMLKVSYNDLPDSVGKVSLGVATVDTLDSTFTRGARDSIVLTYDYLPADSDGISYPVSLKASGSFYGKDTVLYAADTTISAVSGVDKSYTIALKWVGPGIPNGAASITVTIGAVGTTVLNAGFNEMGGRSSLVDDLEDGDGLTRYNTWWYTYSDVEDGGLTQVTPPHTTPAGGPSLPVAGGANNSAYCASVTYSMSKGDNEYDPYAGMGLVLNPDTLTGLDISTATGIRFYAKGNKFRVRVETKSVTDYGWWGYDVPASTDWQLIDLTWSQFNQPGWADGDEFDRTAAIRISFEVNGKTGDAGTIWVDDIQLPGYLR